MGNVCSKSMLHFKIKIKLRRGGCKIRDATSTKCNFKCIQEVIKHVRHEHISKMYRYAICDCTKCNITES